MTLAIIAGTGFEDLPELELARSERIGTAWGDASAPVQRGTLEGTPVLFLSRHGADHRYAPHEVNYRANVAALREAGATAILAVYTVGGITAPVRTPGSLVVPDQIVDYTWGRAHSYSMPGEVIHVDFTEPFDATLRQALVGAARLVVGDAVPVVDGGVYAATQGPRLETAAEVDRLERDGCDVVGMTGMPEAGLAAELGLPIAGIALVVNPAAGRGSFTLDEIHATAAAGRERVLHILALAAKTLGDAD